MPPDKTPITKTDIAIISGEIKALRDLMENELRHLREEVTENTAWRQEFMKENGLWRKINSRVQSLEYLARSVKWAVGAMMTVLTPICIWASIEIIKAVGAWLRAGP